MVFRQRRSHRFARGVVAVQVTGTRGYHDAHRTPSFNNWDYQRFVVAFLLVMSMVREFFRNLHPDLGLTIIARVRWGRNVLQSINQSRVLQSNSTSLSTYEQSDGEDVRTLYKP